jgi:trigger factor
VCDENGNSLEDGHYHSTILINSVPDNETKNKLIGLKPQDEILLEASKTWKDKEDIKARFHIDDEKAEKIKTLKFRLEKINRIEPAQVNQELFEKIYGPGIVNTEEEFKEKIREELEKNIALDSDFKLRKDLREKLLSQINFSLPDEFLKKWILASNEKPISIQQLEKEYDSYSKMLRWQLVENRFIKENNIEVKWEEVVEQTQQLISMQYLKMGLPIPEAQELQTTVSKILQNNEEAKRIFDNLYDTKLFNLYKSKITVQPKEIAYDEFVKHLQE